MKRIVVSASLLLALHADGAKIHITGPDERQVEFGDGTTAFATLSGGEGCINSTVNVYAPDFVDTGGVSMKDLVSLVAVLAADLEETKARIAAVERVNGMVPPPLLPPSSPPASPLPPLPPPPSPSPPPVDPISGCTAHSNMVSGYIVRVCEGAQGSFFARGHQHGRRATARCWRRCLCHKQLPQRWSWSRWRRLCRNVFHLSRCAFGRGWCGWYNDQQPRKQWWRHHGLRASCQRWRRRWR